VRMKTLMDVVAYVDEQVARAAAAKVSP
jgi:hypothetical protein